ncbi:conserved hypothetical protein [Cupriavidus taiwanensis]|uniref:Uncharacterized protein n=1 Tax=Cupriavidus taiwanensis TaxID=164546 RepID=A0A375JAZ6_9BURK|nr:conserved hypothetical protein [Cupriavidus taiwanensis]
MVASDGTVTDETFPRTKEFDGGFYILQLPSREAPSCGLRRLPKLAVARRNSARSGMTPRVNGQVGDQ